MKVAVYDKTGKEVESMPLPKEIFEVKLNPDLLHQVVLGQEANRRKKIAKAKGRGEVRGGGKKPWAQKGTGRARHGSTRSPIWVGGGTTFGPILEKNFKKGLNKKMKRKALFMVLSEKAKNDLIIVIDDLKTEKPKTKPMAELFLKLFLNKGTGLAALSMKNENAEKSIRNIGKMRVAQARDLNALDLLNSKYLVLEKQSIKAIKDTFAKKFEEK